MSGTGGMRIGDDVAWTGGGDRIVVLNLASPDARPFVLEATAAHVWEAVAEEQATTVDALTHLFAEEYDASVEEIRVGVAALVAELRDRGLLVDAMAER